MELDIFYYKKNSEVKITSRQKQKLYSQIQLYQLLGFRLVCIEKVTIK